MVRGTYDEPGEGFSTAGGSSVFFGFMPACCRLFPLLLVVAGLLPGHLTAAPRYVTIEEAIARGDLADVRAHLASDPTAATRAGKGGLPLHQAILRNKAEIALLLLESGASADVPDRTARTPLHLAVERGNVALVTALLARHAKPNERDSLGWTPLHHAAAENKVAVARALLSGRADPKTLSERGGTPLHEAAASAGAEMIRLLLDAGVDPASCPRPA